MKDTMKKLFKFSIVLAVVCSTLGLYGCSSNTDSVSDSGTKAEVPADVQLPTEGMEYMLNDSLANYETYCNSFQLPDEWEQYGIGDPSITKYNGVYYLYASTPYQQIGVRCWSSKNLVDWTYEGNISEDEATFTAYSPKVIYWNGMFYLYTTPNGEGMHVLTSDSPTGPFVDVTGYIHDCIDACILIDDDGTWYMTHGAAGNGVEMHKMPAQLQIDEYPLITGAVVSGGMGNAWTETGQIIKRNDRYFATISGNHVCNTAYRTNWAVTSDLTELFTLGDMPLVCSTEGNLEGTGCGLVFQGPDLLSDYVVYHNLINPYVGPVRAMNIDRVSYNGDRMIAYGATDYVQIVPELPDVYEYFEDTVSLNENWDIQGTVSAENSIGTMSSGSIMISKETTQTFFVSEYNLIPASGTKAVFSYKDENNYKYIDLKADGQIWLAEVINGQDNTVVTGTMQTDYNPDSMHCIQVVSDGDGLKVYVDTMKKLSADIVSDYSGKTGYMSTNDSRVGFIAFSNGTSQDQTKAAYKPISGSVQAIDFITEDKASDTVTVPGKSGGQAVTLTQDDWYRYKILSPEAGAYTVDITYRSETEVRAAVTDVSGVILGWADLPPTQGEWYTYPIRETELKGDVETIAVVAVEGSFDFYELQFHKETEVIEESIACVLNDENGWKYYDGMWSGNGNEMTMNCVGSFGKVSYGDYGWSDYAVEATVTVSDMSFGSAGFLVCVQNISNGSDYALNHPTNDQSYYIYVTASGEVGIRKHNFSDEYLMSDYFEYQDEGTTCTLRTEVHKNEIVVYVDGIEMLCYTDYENPYTTGKIGLHGEDADAVFGDIRIKPMI